MGTGAIEFSSTSALDMAVGKVAFEFPRTGPTKFEIFSIASSTVSSGGSLAGQATPKQARKARIRRAFLAISKQRLPFSRQFVLSAVHGQPTKAGRPLDPGNTD
jgi:hypothetical protein